MGRTRLRLAALATTLALAAPLIAQEPATRAREEARRDEWQKVDEIFAALAVKAGAVVADIGAGRGYFTSRLSRAVGERGRVYAVEIDQAELGRLRARVAEEQLANVEVVEGAPADPRLPPASLDAALIVNAYHEMQQHRAILAAIKTALKADGRLVIVEPISPSRRNASREDQVRSHEIGAAFVQQDAHAAGFAHVQLHDPFTRREQGHDVEWMLVLTPARADTEQAADVHDDEARWKDPDLRITIDEYKRFAASGDVLLLDVRDRDSYEAGHLPGAVSMPLDELETAEGLGKVLGAKTHRIVTYCS